MDPLPLLLRRGLALEVLVDLQGEGAVHDRDAGGGAAGAGTGSLPRRRRSRRLHVALEADHRRALGDADVEDAVVREPGLALADGALPVDDGLDLAEVDAVQPEPR